MRKLQVFGFGCDDAFEAADCTADQSKTQNEQMQLRLFLPEENSHSHFKQWPSAGHKAAGASVKAASQTD